MGIIITSSKQALHQQNYATSLNSLVVHKGQEISCPFFIYLAGGFNLLANNIIMPRPLVIGNGQVLVNFDDKLNIRDFYYPYVGLYNHLNGYKIRMGVWVENKFAWVDHEGWERKLDYFDNTLVTNVVATNKELQVTLHIRDAVYHHENAYLKEVIIENLSKKDREIRLFFTHDFRLGESDIGDTAFYDPYSDSVIHYKMHNYLLIGGSTGDHGIYEYATGIKGFLDFEGTWRDAEDGQLSMNSIAQGSVDSTISFRVQTKASQKCPVQYWIVADEDLVKVVETNKRVMKRGFDDCLNSTAQYWEAWLGKAPPQLDTLPDNVARLFKRSLLIIRSQIDDRGAVIAANDSDIMETARAHYSYVWPRDGAFACYALDQIGYPDITRKFFRFCQGILPKDHPMLMHKYHADGSMGASWHPWIVHGQPTIPFQEDGTALVLWALRHHFDQNKDLEFLQSLYDDFVIPIADFLVKYRDKDTSLPLPSWDLWEERLGVNTFTAAAVWAGLISAQRIARVFGDNREKEYGLAAQEIKNGMLEHLWSEEHNRFLRCLYLEKDGSLRADPTPDSSIFSIPLLGVMHPHDPKVVSTVKSLTDHLWVRSGVGGMARYEMDYYFRIGDGYPGNPWFICTLWLAEYQMLSARTSADLEEPLKTLEWAANHAACTGVLSEQVHPWDGSPLSVSPLTWSHAQYVTTVMQYLDSVERLKER
jgi:GH15 family glucan-1,4-alpha-glucosidase